MKKILVAGAGLTGCTAARLLAEAGHRVELLEERTHIGGNCFDEKTESGITVHTYGPHIFHTNRKDVWDFLCRFASFRLFQHRVLSYAGGQLYPFPVNRDTLCQLFGIELSTQEVPAFLSREVERSTFNSPPQNFRDAIVSQVGETLYETFFANYTAKQWQTNPENLSVDVAGRIPIRSNRDDRYFTDRYQGIPQEGYTALFKKMIDHPNIHLNLNTTFQPGMEKDYDQLIYTGRLDDFFNQSAGALTYRSVRFEIETLDQPEYQPAAVVNYPNDYDFTRITEFKHMTGEKSPVTVIMKEYPVPDGIPCYVVLNQENLGRRTAYRQLIQETLDPNKYFFLGRLAEYQYYNMDQVVGHVMDEIVL